MDHLLVKPEVRAASEMEELPAQMAGRGAFLNAQVDVLEAHSVDRDFYSHPIQCYNADTS